MLTLALITVGCSKEPAGHKLKEGEAALSHYSTGEIKETQFGKGIVGGYTIFKKYEYYPSGQVKKQYEFKDNHYFGPLHYYFADGSTFADGIVTSKSLEIFTAKGTMNYYWPGGKKMLAIDSRTERPEHIDEALYFTETGEVYTNEDLPEDLKEKILATLSDWQDGNI